MTEATLENAAQTTNENTVDIKTENQEYRVYVTLKEDGQSIDKASVVSVNDFDKWEKEHPTETLAIQQSIRKYRFGSVQAFLNTIDDEEEAVNVINRGVAAKFSQKLNAKLLERDETGNLAFQPVEGVYDSLDWLQEETKRKNLTPGEKVERDLKKNAANMSQDDIAKAIAMLQSLMAGQQA